ncbi:LOW QUALITY PROTEIN: hypothetical protein HID58_063854 [Brassica napus]|uniref:3'-5' exonuclease domain-containing protein n=1 Tax=Brassica napus TaxID=3708 RepID=A0ABQ7Z8M8_BRANA|nr:LOW QUALITY PROTEIN: hypothetical protein HID58_063854 [Brassica napus]
MLMETKHDKDDQLEIEQINKSPTMKTKKISRGMHVFSVVMFMLRRRRRRKAFNTRFWRRVVESVRKVHSEITIMPTSNQDGGDDADVINDESGDLCIAKSWILHVLSENQEDPPVIISLNSKTNPQDGAKAATVQLCIKNKCLILQLLHVNQNTNLEECFGDLFRDEKFVFVGIAVTAKKLNGLVTVVKKVDVRDLVKVNYPISYGVRSRLSLKAMASELLGFGSWKPKRQICPRDLARRVLDEEEGDDKKTFDLLLKQLQDEITPKLHDQLLDQLLDPQRRLS